MENEVIMQEAFRNVGADYGYVVNRATFVESCDLKVKWARCGRDVEMWVTDYMKGAPKDILESLARTIFSRMTGDMDEPYGEDLVEYLTKEGFIGEFQPIYLSRLGCASASPVGRYKDLRKCVERLVESKKIKPLPQTYCGWLPVGLGDSAGHSSPLMRSVCINSRLDSNDISDELLDFCVYTQMIKIEQGFSPTNTPNNKLTLAVESYPDSERLIGDLCRIGLSVWRTLSPEC